MRISRRTLLSLVPVSAALPAIADVGGTVREEDLQGLLLECSVSQREQVLVQFIAYCKSLNIDERAWSGRWTAQGWNFYLVGDIADGNTLAFAARPLTWVYDDVVALPAPNGGLRNTRTVSKREILLALLQVGRCTRISANHDMQALDDHIALRQNIVAWAQDLRWGWPEGGSATWNRSLWRGGVPVSKSALADAMLDAMLHQHRYGIGCYAAAKMVYAHSAVDFRKRVRPQTKKLSLLVERLWAGEGPLHHTEPPRAWTFEPGHDVRDDAIDGKVLELLEPAAPRNFVPGDWAYFWNTDPVTYEKTGYEGSNSIYLGRGRFSDYYSDNEGSYSFEQKLWEVYQWRNGVFSQSRDYAKAVAMSAEQLYEFAKAPAQGGMLLPWRMVPRSDI